VIKGGCDRRAHRRRPIEDSGFSPYLSDMLDRIKEILRAAEMRGRNARSCR